MRECFVVVSIETNSTTLNFDYFVVVSSERYISLMRGENYFYKHFWTEYMNGVNLWMNDNVCLEISRLYTRIECSWSGLFIWKYITFKSSQISIKNWLGRCMPHACNLSVYQSICSDKISKTKQLWEMKVNLTHIWRVLNYRHHSIEL